ncbi:extracellular calcium-sensing receptor-like [Rhinatrema bivittatum]|uniref:extracellular calcium-sensing receptor-like n=1 Tax=Rhinatrema bivittatum TaxID=194408 RepID=UPI00112C5B52|nr:extracellular calcium-sensing receptor-like [Rhinatrema bivittatum]
MEMAVDEEEPEEEPDYSLRTNNMCRVEDNKFNVPVLAKAGDVMLGGLFPVRFRVLARDLSYYQKPESLQCEGFDFRAFRWLQTMIFALEEINKNYTLLPNVTLGYRIFDTCNNNFIALKGMVSLISAKEEMVHLGECMHPISAAIGEAGSTQSITISRIMTPFQLPLVSYSATCDCLSNKLEYPSFLRTVPSDKYQVMALIHLVIQYGWEWIGIIASDDDYGQYGLAMLTEQLKRADICIDFSFTIPKLYTQEKITSLVRQIQKSTAKVLIAFTTEGELYPLVKEIVQQNVSSKQWIASEAWVTAALLSKQEFLPALVGTIGFAIRRAYIPGLKEFLLRLRPSKGAFFANMLWEALFKCKLNFSDNPAFETTALTSPVCDGSENLQALKNIYSDTTQLRVSYNVYKAVYTVAHALHNLMCAEKIQLFSTCTQALHFEPWQLLHRLKTVKFQNQFGEEVYFDGNGKSAAIYDLINWQKDYTGTAEFVQVGVFDASAPLDEQLVINMNISWAGGGIQVPRSVCSESCPPGSRKAVREREPVCCFDCFSCADGEFSNETGSSACRKCPSDYWSNHGFTKCIPRQAEYLSLGDAMGIALTVVALIGISIAIAVLVVFFHHKNTPIVKANNSELSFLLLGSLVLCFLCSLTFIGQPSTWSCMVRHTAFAVSFVLCISCIFAKTTVVVVAFKVTSPSSSIMKWFGPLQQKTMIFLCTFMQILICVTWLIISPPFPSRDTSYRGAKVLFLCNVGSSLAFYLTLSYIGLLCGICFVLAFLARRLPDRYNEAKYITFGMIIFFAVWIAFIPAYLSSTEKYTVAVEIFAIQFSSFGLLICIFTYKCYMLLRPDQNLPKTIRRMSSRKEILFMVGQ